jgi:hypothetical protein
MKQMTPCLGLQEDYNDIYKKNSTKLQKFKKAAFKKELQPAYFEVKTTSKQLFVLCHHNQTLCWQKM